MARPRLRPVLVAVTCALSVLVSCSSGPGPPETSAADAPVRATTTTTPPPPVVERVVMEAVGLAGPGDQRMVAVAAGTVSPGAGPVEGRIVAVGRAEGRAAAWWSPDGRAWQRVDPGVDQFGDATSLADVVADPVVGGWVAVGADGDQAAAWTTPDGVRWQRAEVDTGPALTMVESTTSGLLASGTSDESADGGGEIVIWQSYSGRRWVRAVANPDLFARPGLLGVAAVVDAATEVQVVVDREGQGPELWRSGDGLFWSSATPADTELLAAGGRPTVGGALALGSSVVLVGSETKADGTDAALWSSVGESSSGGPPFLQIPHDEESLGGDGIQSMAAVARAGDDLVAVGTETLDGGDVDAVVWSSPLGSPPQRISGNEQPLPGNQYVVDLTVAGSVPVAVGWETSPEGEDAVVWLVVPGDPGDGGGKPGAPVGPRLGWQRVEAGPAWSGPDEQRMDGVVATADGFVAVGSVGGAHDTGGADGAVWRSTDGRDWRRVGDGPALGGPGDQRLVDLASGPGGLVAVGVDGESAAAWWSPDGEIWSRVAHDEAIFGGPAGQRMEAVVARGAAGWVAVGSDDGSGSLDAAIWRSDDGLSWTRVPGDALAGDGDQGLADVAVGPEGLIAVGVDGPGAAAWTSADGTAWSRQGVGLGRAAGVATSGTAVLAVGSVPVDGLDVAVWRSGEGEGWSPTAGVDLGGPSDQEGAAVSLGEDMSVVVGSTNRGGGDDAAAWASTDGGISWTRSPHAEAVFGGDQAQRMVDVAAFEGLVVAVGFSGSTPDARDAAVWITDLAGGGSRRNL